MSNQLVDFVVRDIHSLATHFKVKAGVTRMEMKTMQSGSHEYIESAGKATAYEEVAFILFHTKLKDSDDKEG